MLLTFKMRINVINDILFDILDLNHRRISMIANDFQQNSSFPTARHLWIVVHFCLEARRRLSHGTAIDILPDVLVFVPALNYLIHVENN